MSLNSEEIDESKEMVQTDLAPEDYWCSKYFDEFMKNKKLEHTIRGAEEENEKLRVENEKFGIENEKLRYENEELENENEQLKHENGELEIENGELENDKEVIRQANLGLYRARVKASKKNQRWEKWAIHAVKVVNREEAGRIGVEMKLTAALKENTKLAEQCQQEVTKVSQLEAKLARETKKRINLQHRLCTIMRNSCDTCKKAEAERWRADKRSRPSDSDSDGDGEDDEDGKFYYPGVLKRLCANRDSELEWE
jgi:chromosome segregation ATPase